MSRTDDDILDLPTDNEYEENTSNEGYFDEYVEDEESIYNSENYISGPILSEICTISENILEFDFSYGYDCRRYFNIAVPDENTILFASGNLINFFDANTREIRFRRSALGGGIGSIAVNPDEKYSHVAIAENGNNPIIIVYEWPSFDINCILRGGSSKTFTYCDYSPNGELLVSQAGEPDYMVTIFNWPKHRILLRTKSYVNDIYRVKFSPYVPGQLTSCGVTHIKFWKMARTFTGLKLKGYVGKFGKTEYTDVLGILPMPDEKVICGCDWGNILIWDGEIIKLEVFRPLRKPCHSAPIVQFFYKNGELWSVSMDGHVKVWPYEKIDQADPPDDDRIVMTDPTFDIHIPDTMLMSIKKILPHDPESTKYYAQDGNGGLWLIDLNLEDAREPPEQLYQCHAGKVTDIATCPFDTFVASVGYGGRLYMYDYSQNTIMFSHQFLANGTSLIWLPLSVSPYGDELIIGYDDGCIRICLLVMVSQKPAEIKLLQIIKPHNKAITKLLMNTQGDVLISGSEDSTIFIFQMHCDNNVTVLTPIGFIKVPDVVTHLTWHFQQEYTVLVGCDHGHFLQVKVPNVPQDYTKISYALNLNPNFNRFTTYKAQIRRDIRIRQIEEKKAEKVAKKRAEMEKIKKENPGVEIDEEVFLADSETEEELEPLHIPEIPNRVIWLQSTEENTVWLSMGGYDAGYIYEYKIDQKDEVPYRFKMVDDADDIEIINYIYTSDKKYLIFSMEDGVIRVNKVNKKDFTDLQDYWKLSMHDNLNGVVPRMCFSFDEKYFFTCGYDGNLFSYKFNARSKSFMPDPSRAQRFDIPEIEIEDVDNTKTLSLEEGMIKAENDRIDAVANKHKNLIRKQLQALESRFNKDVLAKNDKLLPSQTISQEDLILDKRVNDYIDLKLQENLNMVERKLAYDVEKSKVGMEKLYRFFVEPLEKFPITVNGIFENISVKSLRHRHMHPGFADFMQLIEEKMIEAELKGRPPERHVQDYGTTTVVQQEEEPQVEYFLMGLTPSVIENSLGPRLGRMLNKYKMRKLRWKKRREEWERFLVKKPKIDESNPEDEAVLEHAKSLIGDYKLKSDDNYKVSPQFRETTVKKYKQLLSTKEKQFNLLESFNKKMYALREEKEEIRKTVKILKEKLLKIQVNIPKGNHLEIAEIEEDLNSEFPEKNLIPEVIDTKSKENKEPPIVAEKDFTSDIVYQLLTSRPLPEFSNLEKLLQPRIKNVLESHFKQLLIYSQNEKQDTPWEFELRTLHFTRQIFEQYELVDKAKQLIQTFNKKITNLLYERQEIKVRSLFLDIHLLVLLQELKILKRFETVEDSLQENVNAKLATVLDMQDAIRSIESKINDCRTEVVRLNVKEKNIQDQFIKMVQEHKFVDFLKKVFKKKYRPPKVKSEGSSSESSSSSSSSESEDENETGSIDSRDFGFIKQDLNVCPKGCDKYTFDYTVSLRTERHAIEISTREITKQIEAYKVEVEFNKKKLKSLDNVLASSRNDLESYQREKQKLLNEVQRTVILKLHQLQHLNETEEEKKINQCILFSKAKLSQLYKRVGELNRETLEQKSIYQVNVKHMIRMNTDCAFMSKKISKLKSEMVTLMRRKFGKIINILEIEERMINMTFGNDDLNDLAELVLKRMVVDLKVSLTNLGGTFVNHISFLKRQKEKDEMLLAEEMRTNSERLELLTALQGEKLFLSTEVAAQKRRQQSGHEDTFTSPYEEENDKLSKIAASQRKQIQDLKDEILRLRTKGLPATLPKKAKKTILVEEEGSEVSLDYETFLASYNYGQIPEEDVYKKTPKQITVPSMVSVESEEIAKEIIREMLDKLGSILTRRSVEMITLNILEFVMNKASVQDIVNKLIENLPLQDASSNQLEVIQDAAEKLSNIKEPEVSDEDIFKCAAEIVEEIINDVTTRDMDSYQKIATIVQELLDTLPGDFLSSDRSINLVSSKIMGFVSQKTDKQEFRRRVFGEVRTDDEEMYSILDSIIEKVFDTGLDISHWIKL